MGLISMSLDRERRAPGERRNHLHLDTSDGRMIYTAVTDVEPTLKAAAAMRANGDGYTQDRSMVKVGHIDTVILEQWMKRRGVTDRSRWTHPDMLLEFLEDPDNAQFRTAEGRFLRKPLREYKRASTARIVKG